MFTDLKPLIDAAQKFVGDTINDQIEQARLEISAQQKKIKRLKAQRALMARFAKELTKPPKPFYAQKLTKAQRKRLEKLRRQAVPTAVMAPAVGM